MGVWKPRVGQRGRRNIWSAKLQETVLEGIRAYGGSLAAGARAANVSISRVWKERQTNPEFEALVKEAIEQGAESLEAEAVRRAQEGFYETVYSGGKKVGRRIRYSDYLLGLLLKGKKPQYREIRTDNTNHNVPITPEALAAAIQSLDSEGEAKLAKLLSGGVDEDSEATE